METKLAENIRFFRKQKSLTQEQLAEVLGVTVGAVHKWETRLSTPELNLITEMADFFDVSVDVLLGHEIRDNRLKATVERLAVYLKNEDPQGLAEAEKALKRFPHAFEVVYYGALMHMVFGGVKRDNLLLARARELLEEALILLPQNRDPRISDIGIHYLLSTIFVLQGKGEEAVSYLEKHNPEGFYDAEIGMVLALICKDTDKAQTFISAALIESVSKAVQTALSGAVAFVRKGDYRSAEDLLHWGIGVVDGVKKPEVTGFVDRSNGYLYLALAYTYSCSGRKEEAREMMKRAKQNAVRFDQAPNYDARSLRFVSGIDTYQMHEIISDTAMGSLKSLIGVLADEELSGLWENVKIDEEADVI